MICHECNVPMITEEGSENGYIRPEHYLTEEIKVCKKCGLRVLEHYDAKFLEKIIQE